MSNDKRLFTIAGTSTFRGVNTFRFATGSAHSRSLILKRNGHIEIKLVDLPQAMTKADAMLYLKSKGVEAVVPKTGRGSGLTSEDIEAQQKIIEASVVAAAAHESSVRDADAEWLSNLGK